MTYEKSYKGQPLVDLTGSECAYIRYLDNIIGIHRARNISISQSTAGLVGEGELTITADSINIERVHPDVMADIRVYESMYPSPKPRVKYESMYQSPRPRVMFQFPEIKNVIFHDPATIVFWSDGSKTIVKCQDDDIFDPEKGLAMAISKKVLGNKSNFNNEFKKWLPEERSSE